MKKIGAIFLLALQLFNWFGYRLLTAFLENEANVQMEASLDMGTYDPAALVAIRVPITHLAYYINSKEFERVDGEIDIGMVKYNYVKKRIFNDSVELLCIPNQQATQWQNVKSDFFKVINDLQHNGQNKKSTPVSAGAKPFPLESYRRVEDEWLVYFFTIETDRPWFKAPQIPAIFLAAIENPPEFFG